MDAFRSCSLVNLEQIEETTELQKFAVFRTDSRDKHELLLASSLSSVYGLSLTEPNTMSLVHLFCPLGVTATNSKHRIIAETQKQSQE